MGSTNVSLSALCAGSVDLESKAATVEGAFVLQPPRRIKQMLHALPAGLQPTVGVSVALRREIVAQQVHILTCVLVVSIQHYIGLMFSLAVSLVYLE